MRRLLGALLVPLLSFATPAETPPIWEFNSLDDLAAWVPNGHFENVTLVDGAVQADATGTDPFFHCQNLSIPASARQYVLIRIRADRPGTGDLFWSGQTAGPYGGLNETKKNSFSIRGDCSWEEIPVFPFWQTEGIIRQLRLDLYEGGRFGIDSIQILEWSTEPLKPETPWVWNFNGDFISPWGIHPNADLFLTSAASAPTLARDWATVRLRSEKDGVASIVWATSSKQGLQSEEFDILGDGRLRSYPIRLKEVPGWGEPLLAFGLRLPITLREGVFLESVQVGEEPTGPAEWAVTYFGFENAPNRALSGCQILARLTNIGADPANLETIQFETPQGIKVLKHPQLDPRRVIGFGESLDFSWEVQANAPGDYLVRIVGTGEGGPLSATATLDFTASPGLPQVSTVPQPRPIKTSLDVCAYYFPGWNTPQKWDCIRETAPIRKPVLGYYDESNPECVDWQIKWAVENGISCFLVDWYWVRGTQQLTHWFEAYRNSQHRNFLKVAIMWANHNPPGTHSREDWREVTRHWIDHYFPLETYYRLDNLPVVFLWDPRLIRSDLGGSQEVRAAFDESMSMAKAAGFLGIRFIALHDHDSESQAEQLLSEGYTGSTNYHEWGDAPNLADSPNRMTFEDVVQSASQTWRERDQECGSLEYFPVVDTGWDARPWHGRKAQVIRNRNPELFEQLLLEARAFCQENEKKFVVLGPVNEWGEGSYIEPCVEFGFDMYERIRKVFGTPEPSDWPINIGPSDIGLGPYDFK